jgi:GntR family transcriptional regulator
MPVTPNEILNPRSPLPLYHQLAELLAARIRAGDYPPGTRIPSEHQLAGVFAIGRPTARQAIDVLVRKGLVTRRRGSGTYVREPRQEVDLFSLLAVRRCLHFPQAENAVFAELFCRTDQFVFSQNVSEDLTNA